MDCIWASALSSTHSEVEDLPPSQWVDGTLQERRNYPICSMVRMHTNYPAELPKIGSQNWRSQIPKIPLFRQSQIQISSWWWNVAFLDRIKIYVVYLYIVSSLIVTYGYKISDIALPCCILSILVAFLPHGWTMLKRFNMFEPPLSLLKQTPKTTPGTAWGTLKRCGCSAHRAPGTCAVQRPLGREDNSKGGEGKQIRRS